MEIGTVKVASRLALAPMAGVTDLGFRTVCRALGCGYTVTEMVSAKALCYQDKKSVPLLKLGEGEHPAAAQIFGSDPKCMEEAAAIAGEVSGAEIIDINMGCPVPKVANSGDGSGLMRTPELAVRVAEAVIRGAGGRPVTVKMRLGWDKGSINCVEFARAMEEAGVSAVAVHGRTRAQQYAGTANWDQIRAVKEALSIPVLANGDVFSPRDAVRILQYTLPAGAGRPGGGGDPAPAAAYGAVRYGHGAVPHQRPPQGGEDRLPGGPEAVLLVSQGRALCRVLERADLPCGDHGGAGGDHPGHQAGFKLKAERQRTCMQIGGSRGKAGEGDANRTGAGGAGQGGRRAGL